MGHLTMGDWVAAYPSDAKLYRRALLANGSKTKRRHGTFLCAPIVLASLADGRISADCKKNVAESFDVALC